MGRVTPATRDEAVQRIANGDSYALVAEWAKVPQANVRKWVSRARGGAVVSIAPDAPAVDLSTLSPIALLEHDIAEARVDLDAARKDRYHNALPSMRSQLRKMQTELESLRASQAEEVEDDDAEVLALLIDHMRAKTWVRGVLDDRQARTIVEAIQRERTDP